MHQISDKIVHSCFWMTDYCGIFLFTEISECYEPGTPPPSCSYLINYNNLWVCSLKSQFLGFVKLHDIFYLVPKFVPFFKTDLEIFTFCLHLRASFVKIKLYWIELNALHLIFQTFACLILLDVGNFCAAFEIGLIFCPPACSWKCKSL